MKRITPIMRRGPYPRAADPGKGPAGRPERGMRRRGWRPCAHSRIAPTQARRLASVLPPLEPGAVVLGLARGGVPVAHEVSAARRLPLDVLVVRKVGHPRQPEYALGAVSEDGVTLPGGPAGEPGGGRSSSRRARRLSRCAQAAGASRCATARWWSSTTAWPPAVRWPSPWRRLGARGAARLVMAVPGGLGARVPGAGRRVRRPYAVALVEPPEFLAVGPVLRRLLAGRRCGRGRAAEALGAAGP